MGRQLELPLWARAQAPEPGSELPAIRVQFGRLESLDAESRPLTSRPCDLSEGGAGLGLERSCREPPPNPPTVASSES